MFQARVLESAALMKIICVWGVIVHSMILPVGGIKRHWKRQVYCSGVHSAKRSVNVESLRTMIILSAGYCCCDVRRVKRCCSISSGILLFNCWGEISVTSPSTMPDQPLRPLSLTMYKQWSAICSVCSMERIVGFLISQGKLLNPMEQVH